MTLTVPLSPLFSLQWNQVELHCMSSVRIFSSTFFFFANKSYIALALWRPCWSLTGLLLVLWKNFGLESFGPCSQLKSPLLVSTKINLFSLWCHETTSLTLIPDFILFFSSAKTQDNILPGTQKHEVLSGIWPDSPVFFNLLVFCVVIYSRSWGTDHLLFFSGIWLHKEV